MDEKTKQIAQAMMSEMDQELLLEKGLQIHAAELARALSISNSVRTTIKNVEVVIKYEKKDKDLILYIFDLFKLKMAGGRYRPAVFNAKEVSDFSPKENLEKIILTALYYEHDIIKPEEILEGED